MPVMPKIFRLLCIVVFGLLLNLRGLSQELEPRVMSPTPVGLNIVLLGYAYSNGNIVLDSSLPIEDADAKVHSLTLGYTTSFSIFSRMAKLDVIIPFSNAS